MNATLKSTLSMVIFGTIGVFRRYIPLPSSMVAMTRGIVGMLFLLAFLRIRKVKLNGAAIKKNLWTLIVSGAVMGVNWILLFEAYRYTTVATATICYYMAPVFLVLASPLSHLFVGYDEGLLELTKRGFYIFSFSFLFSGISIFGSSFFTALGDGLTSAVISFLRTMVFQMLALFLLPIRMGEDGIWWSVVGCEGMAMAVSLFFFCRHRHKFHYA